MADCQRSLSTRCLSPRAAVMCWQNGSTATDSRTSWTTCSHHTVALTWTLHGTPVLCRHHLASVFLLELVFLLWLWVVKIVRKWQRFWQLMKILTVIFTENYGQQLFLILGVLFHIYVWMSRSLCPVSPKFLLPKFSLLCFAEVLGHVVWWLEGHLACEIPVQTVGKIYLSE